MFGEKCLVAEVFDLWHLKSNGIATNLIGIKLKDKSFSIIVPKDEVSLGDEVFFIYPDTVVGDDPIFSVFKLAKDRRIKAKNMGFAKVDDKSIVYSEGIVLSKNRLSDFGYDMDTITDDDLGLHKFEEVIDKRFVKSSSLPRFIKKTDEFNIKSSQSPIDNKAIEFGGMYDITEKIDGKSTTIYYNNGEYGICSRNQELSLSSNDKQVTVAMPYLKALIEYCEKRNANIYLQGELYGKGIQTSINNYWSKLDNDIMFFNCVDFGICHALSYNELKNFLLNLGIGDKIVPLLGEICLGEINTDSKEKILDIIKNNYFGDYQGRIIEGVVIRSAMFSHMSAKYLNELYDSKK